MDKISVFSCINVVILIQSSSTMDQSVRMEGISRVLDQMLQVTLSKFRDWIWVKLLIIFRSQRNTRNRFHYAFPLYCVTVYFISQMYNMVPPTQNICCHEAVVPNVTLYTTLQKWYCAPVSKYMTWFLNDIWRERVLWMIKETK